MTDTASTEKGNTSLYLAMNSSDIAREDLTRFVEWQARFKIAPDDPLYGLVLAVRATLQNSIVASNAAVHAVAANDAIEKRLKEAKEELAYAFREASTEAKGAIEKSAQQASRKISTDFTRSVGVQVEKLIHSTNRLEIQAKLYRQRALADATASFVGAVRMAALEEFKVMTWRSRLVVAIIAIGILMLAAVGGALITQSDMHYTLHHMEHPADGKLRCGVMDIVGVGKRYACIISE